MNIQRILRIFFVIVTILNRLDVNGIISSVFYRWNRSSSFIVFFPRFCLGQTVLQGIVSLTFNSNSFLFLSIVCQFVGRNLETIEINIAEHNLRSYGFVEHLIVVAPIYGDSDRIFSDSVFLRNIHRTSVCAVDKPVHLIGRQEIASQSCNILGLLVVRSIYLCNINTGNWGLCNRNIFGKNKIRVSLSGNDYFNRICTCICFLRSNDNIVIDFVGNSIRIFRTCYSYQTLGSSFLIDQSTVCSNGHTRNLCAAKLDSKALRIRGNCSIFNTVAAVSISIISQNSRCRKREIICDELVCCQHLCAAVFIGCCCSGCIISSVYRGVDMVFNCCSRNSFSILIGNRNRNPVRMFWCGSISSQC